MGSFQVSLRSRVRPTIRRAVRRLPPPARRRLSRTVASLPGKRRQPLVTIVVPVTDVQAAYLDECFDSLRSQTHRLLQIIVVPHGPSARAAAVAAVHASQDWRIEIHGEVCANLGAARNVGALQARGAYVGFAGAADTVPDNAVAAMVASLERSRSAFVVGRATGQAAGGEGDPQLVHKKDMAAVHITEFPDVIKDVVVE